MEEIHFWSPTNNLLCDTERETETIFVFDRLYPEEFSALLLSFSNRFLEFVETQTLDGKHRKKRQYTLYKNSCLPTWEDQLLFILIYLREAMTQDVLGELFGMSQPVSC